MIPGVDPVRRRSNRHSSEQGGRGGSSSSRSSRHYHYPSRPRAQPPQYISDTASSSSTSAQSDARPCRTRLPLLRQRRSETDAHRVALEARNRLDERLREAALSHRRSVESSLPRLAQHYFNALAAEDEQDESLLLEDEGELEVSLREWLAGQVPSFREAWEPEWVSEAAAAVPRLPVSRGLSKAVVNALPREVYKASKQQQQECSVCLETFLKGQSLVRLPCKHRFHTACITPWLEQHEQCPYCRDHISKGLAAARSEDNLLSWLEAFETGMSRLRLSS